MAIKINKNIVIEDTNVALKDLVPTNGMLRNGYYTKFPDGTMIVFWNSANINVRNGGTWTWDFSDAGFSGNYQVAVISDIKPWSQGYNYFVSQDYNNSTTSRTFHIYHSYGADLNLILDLVAIGRWK